MKNPDVLFEVSSSETNVNVKCNPGFYQQIAKPAFSTLSEGFSFTINNINLYCSSKTISKDLAGTIERELIKFGFKLDNSSGVISVHLHHTTQLIQVQGSLIMPDSSTAAVWFVKYAMESRFKSLSKTQKYLQEKRKRSKSQPPDKNRSQKLEFLSTSHFVSSPGKDRHKLASNERNTVNSNSVSSKNRQSNIRNQNHFGKVGDHKVMQDYVRCQKSKHSFTDQHPISRRCIQTRV